MTCNIISFRDYIELNCRADRLIIMDSSTAYSSSNTDSNENDSGKDQVDGLVENAILLNEQLGTGNDNSNKSFAVQLLQFLFVLLSLVVVSLMATSVEYLMENLYKGSSNETQEIIEMFLQKVIINGTVTH